MLAQNDGGAPSPSGSWGLWQAVSSSCLRRSDGNGAHPRVVPILFVHADHHLADDLPIAQHLEAGKRFLER